MILVNLIAALAPVLSVVVLFYLQKKGARKIAVGVSAQLDSAAASVKDHMNERDDATSKKLTAIKEIVNGTLHRVRARAEILEGLLIDNGIPVPPDDTEPQL